MILEILELIKVRPRYSAKTEDQVNANRLYLIVASCEKIFEIFLGFSVILNFW